MQNPSVRRERTAIVRHGLSRPIKLALDNGLISSQTTVVDYGCGRGDDIRGLRSLGIECEGWDPVYYPDGTLSEADVVNLGYVVNVIEDPLERTRTVQDAWALSRRLLIVSARLEVETSSLRASQYADGYLTQKNTFQKFFRQDELRQWLDATLGIATIAGGPGVFLAFRDEVLKTQFVASQYRGRPAVPQRERGSDAMFERYRRQLEPLMEFVATRGRLPDKDEFKQADDIEASLGSLGRAFRIIRQVTGRQQWKDIARERAKDLSVYLALARFDGRQRATDLPADCQRDVRAFFGTYAAACEEADRLLFSSGNIGAVDDACKTAPCGKLTPEALYIHVASLSRLQPILRVYEGCGRRYIGVVEDANIIKLHRQRPQVSYLCYPTFDEDAHPALLGSLTLSLQTFRMRYQDYSNSENPFILHRKEEFVHEGYPGRERFARLTRQEEKHGLFETAHLIGTRKAWNETVQAKGLRVVGHRLMRAKR